MGKHLSCPFFCLTLLAASVFFSPVCAQTPGELTGNINGVLGVKMLTEEWDPNDTHYAFVVQADVRKHRWPVSVALDILASGNEESRNGADVRGSTLETDVGLRKIWEGPGVAPFLSGGVAIIRARQEIETAAFGGRLIVDVDDVGAGLWTAAELLFRLTERLNVGVTARYSYAEAEIFGNDLNVGGFTFGLLGGVHF